MYPLKSFSLLGHLPIAWPRSLRAPSRSLRRTSRWAAISLGGGGGGERLSNEVLESMGRWWVEEEQAV